MNGIRVVACSLIACSIACAQTTKTPPGQKAAKPKPNVIVIPVPPVQPKVKMLSSVWLEPPQVSGRRIVLQPPRRIFGPGDFRAFIDVQIRDVAREFELNPAAVRKLRIAAKGVIHRLSRQKNSTDLLGRPVVQRGVILLGPQPRVDKTKEFRERLHKNRIWQSAIKQVLTKEQFKAWVDHHVYPDRGVARLLGTPTGVIPSENP